MIEFKNVGFGYSSKKGIAKIFENLDFTIKDNEFFCVIGPSGCGKTTLLRNVAGFEHPTEGVIMNDGRPVEGIDYRRAMVFQDDAVFPWLTVYKNVEYGLKVRGVSDDVRQEKVKHYINLVGLTGCENALPKELSGGMRKRVDLARVLANEPEVLLMDEPFGALDAMTKEVLQEKLVQIWNESKRTIFFITHDIEEALFLGDRVGLLHRLSDGGELEFFNVPFDRPRDIYLKQQPEFQAMRRRLAEKFHQSGKGGAES